MEEKKRIWIVGASSGIGLELAKIFLSYGHNVVLSSRYATSNTELQKLLIQYSQNAYLLNINMKRDSLEEEIKEAWNVFGGFDIWFYNVGVYEMISLDNWDIEKLKNMYETNYLGCVKMIGSMFHLFKNQGYGKWVWNLSLSSLFGLPKGGGYSSSKAALLNLAQSIEPELRDIKVSLQVINHGFVKTRLTDKNDFNMPYLMDSKYAARKISEGVLKDKFEVTFPFRLTIILKALSILPYKFSLALTRRLL